ncbi:hypothetical protein, partial [Endozoicomonas sp. ONNA2]|uniref:hypothetical protein n=1 Tax=Endozoicomonas sp. ONNA2 TaxID=2828741 RepID=UPI002147DCD8
ECRHKESEIYDFIWLATYTKLKFPFGLKPNRLFLQIDQAKMIMNLTPPSSHESQRRPCQFAN